MQTTPVRMDRRRFFSPRFFTWLSLSQTQIQSSNRGQSWEMSVWERLTYVKPDQREEVGYNLCSANLF